MYARDAWDGKEGVDGSSPSEGFRLSPAHAVFCCLARAACSLRDVHRASTNVHRRRVQFIEEANRMFPPVAREVAVVAVDHGQAGAHVARKLERRDAGT